MAVADRHRAFLDLVVDPRKHAISSRFALTKAYQRLDLAGEAVTTGQDRPLPGHVGEVPVEHVAEQNGRLVVQVVAGRDYVVAPVERGSVKDVALREPAGRTRHPVVCGRPGLDVVAVVAGQVDVQ